MTVQTKIAELHADRILVHGYNLVKMGGRYSFGDTVYLLLMGELPPGREGDLLEAMLVLTAVHGITFASYERAIDSHIRNLRRKLRGPNNGPDYVVTVHGVGYKFAEQSE